MNKNAVWTGAVVAALVSWLYGNTLSNPALSLVFMMIVPALVILAALLTSSSAKD